MTIQERKNYLVSNIIDEVVKYFIADEGIDVITAIDRIYKSPVIDWLEDREQDLTSQSPAYIYELIKRYPHPIN